MKKLEVLIAQLDEHIHFFELESLKHKILHRRIRYAIIIATALSSVLASLTTASLLDPRYNIFVVLITSAIGVLSSIEGLRKPSELWLHERSIYHALEDLRREIDFEIAGQSPVTEETVNGYFSKIQNLLSQGSIEWRQQILKTPDKKH